MVWMMIASLVLLGALVPLVGGYSTGAGSCAGNGAPVAGKHLSRVQITSGSLEAYGIKLTLGDSGPLKTGVPFEFEYGRPHFLTLSCSSKPATKALYLGFLVRLASPDGIDTTSALLPFSNDKGTQIATDTCINIEGVGGITHTNNYPKSMSQSILEMDEAAQGLILDVTVVVANSGFYSDFYYSQYTLNAVAPTDGTPSTAQAPTPSSASIFLPTAAQDASSPTTPVPPLSQVTVPTTPNFQVTRPTTPDVANPPSKKQDGAPVASLDLEPIFAPAALPVASPDAAPVALPFAAPATAPANAPAGTVKDSPTATLSGVQDSSPTGSSSRRGTTGFTTYATLSLAVLSSFCFAF